MTTEPPIEDGWRYVDLPPGARAWVWLSSEISSASLLGIYRGEAAASLNILWPVEVGDARFAIRLTITADLLWPNVGRDPDRLPVNAPVMAGLVLLAERRAIAGGAGRLESASVTGRKPMVTFAELMKTPVVVG